MIEGTTGFYSPLEKQIEKVVLYMQHAKVEIDGDCLGLFEVREAQTIDRKNFGRGYERIFAKEALVELHHSLVAEIECILDGDKKGDGINFIAIEYRDGTGKVYGTSLAWDVYHNLRVTSNLDLRIMIGTANWEVTKLFESSPQAFFGFGECGNYDFSEGKDYTDSSRQGENHIEEIEKRKEETAKLISAIKYALCGDTKKRISLQRLILVVSIFDQYVYHQCKENLHLYEYTYLYENDEKDKDELRNCRIENILKQYELSAEQYTPYQKQIDYVCHKLKKKTIYELENIYYYTVPFMHNDLDGDEFDWCILNL